jgi:hypothetical protein
MVAFSPGESASYCLVYEKNEEVHVWTKEDE